MNVDMDALHESTQAALATLPDLEADVIRRHFGIGRAWQSADEISIELNIPADEMQRIITKGLRLLRPRITDRIAGLFQQMALSVSGPLEATFMHFEIFLHKHSGTIQKFFVDMMKWGMQATSAIHQFFSRGTGPIADFRDQLIEWAQIAIDKFNGVAEAIKNITARIQEDTDMAKQFWSDTKNFREGAAEIVGKGWRAAKGLDKSAQQLLGAKSMGDVQQAGDTFKNTMADLLRGFQTKLLRDVFSAPRSGVMREDPELKKQTKLLHDIATKNLQRSGATGQYVLVAG
jgi:hypothetical protein